jgi:arylformamidase
MSLNQRKNRPAAGWIDISVSLRDGMVNWPGDPPVRINRILDVERGDSHTLSAISMGSHSGTHIDAPLHFIKSGKGISDMPVDVAVGRARVLEIEDAVSMKPAELVPFGIRRGERILFKTRNSELWRSDRFVEDFVFLTDEAADFLAARRVKVVGVDYLSVGAFKGGGHAHRALLGAGVWIIEGLDLSQVSPGGYDLICLPLKLDRGDGAPARAIVRRR